MFAEQALAVLRLLVDRMHAGEIAGGAPTDLGDLVFSLAQYIHRLGRDDTALRTKSRFCQLCEAVLARLDCIILSNEAMFRNAVLDWLVDWSLESLKVGRYPQVKLNDRSQRDTESYVSAPESTSKLQLELDQACLHSMVPITESLVLYSASDAAEDSKGVIKSRLFHRHYQHLVRLIEKAHSVEVRSQYLSLISALKCELGTIHTNTICRGTGRCHIQIHA